LDCRLHRHIGSVVVGDVTPALIDALYVRLRRGDNEARPLAAATVARIHVVLNSAFSQAMRWGWVWDNPASRAHRIVVPTNEMRPPTPAELKSLLEFVAPRDRQLELFLTLAACRLLANRAAAASSSSREAFIFSDDDGASAWKPNRVTKSFLRHRRAAGLAPFRLHDLRHFIATERLNAGPTSRGRFAPARPQARLKNLRQVCPRSTRARRAGIGDALARYEHRLKGRPLKRTHRQR
jgi:integrase